MKQMKTIRSLIVLLTAICFGLAVIAFFLPSWHRNSMCHRDRGAGSTGADSVSGIRRTVFWPAPHRRLTDFFHLSAFLSFQVKSSAGLSVGLRK